jgi:hypothetical protein
MVCTNVAHVTVAGSVATWWFAPAPARQSQTAVRASLRRALSTSFGSICYGSLIIAVLQVIHHGIIKP